MADVQCKNGERFAAYGETIEGVEFDGGTIPWEDVDGFWSFHESTQRWMFIPID